MGTRVQMTFALSKHRILTHYSIEFDKEESYIDKTKKTIYFNLIRSI